MTTAPFDAETRAHLEAQAKDAGPWDPAWPLARQRQVWEDQCKRVRARRPDRLMVEDLDVGQEFLETRVLSLGLGGGVDGRTKLGELLGECDLLRLGQCHGLVGRRDRADGGREVVLGSVGQGRDSNKGKKQERTHA